ncbi:DNA mismatch repair protein MutS [Dissulfurirhabdus thermomarina]|uniref:DNA mismatch repair protein MutS n=1 Tax=Dissulfurirhabdus thermomarina TaxID=1765737 RepID=A0A6N9TK83_DISTH|nr:DNA mismatch repair protein MutS [Dissulfurirhabdus thermomarina]NDY41672.1 DNA mismatch repair protein MutS [Dissulfurirhabdus thermomarina]NMX22760.1 DNA mismatch repair protein MutS [Dissulfurirhabdus thermomarina]
MTESASPAGTSAKVKAPAETPMLRQYRAIKAQVPDAILFYRMGDFYEMFFEDAEIAARVLEIALTTRDKHKAEKVPMCGVPVHAAEGYLTRLVQAGYRVAVCEQVEDPAAAKGLVRREVVRVLTPGLLTTEGGVPATANNFVAAVRPGAGEAPWGLACLDLSTGEFRVTELAGRAEAADELYRLEPAEILVPEDEDGFPAEVRRVLPSLFVSTRPPEWFEARRGVRLLTAHFGVLSLDGFGVSGLEAGVGAAGALFSYVEETQKGDLSHIRALRPYHLSEYLRLDEATKRNLELVANGLDGGRRGTLLEVLDFTVTSMGGRLLRHWILYPLTDLAAIEGRHAAVAALLEAPAARADLRARLRRVADLERLVARVSLGTASGRDLVALKKSLREVPGIRDAVAETAASAPLLADLLGGLDPLEDLVAVLDAALREDCPLQLREGRLIREGYNAELDELMAIQRDGRAFIAGVEAAERERTGIPSLKVGFNKVFGYYIEVGKAHAAKVPGHYVRKQTLVAAERYITPELKDVEAKILTAQERRLALEYELFQELRRRVAGEGPRIQETARALARLDVLAGLTEAADRHGYVRPRVNAGDAIDIRDGRHPVVERAVEPGTFVPNDVRLDDTGARLLILTGPNMAGKSTILRQTALIVLMAQMGSFVPAAEAEIGVVDRLFSRVGATDYLARGQSTFMVEMSETANILHNATPRSLVILDEIGRGTSTYDGLAIAWAVAEYLAEKDGRGVKTLFATHYHELTELAAQRPKVRNLHVAVREWEHRIVFLHRLLEGATNRSYGIQVAALAGVPGGVIARAREILANIERDELNVWGEPRIAKTRREAKAPGVQMALPLFPDGESALRRELLALDVNQMTPLEALQRLAELQARARKGG